MQKNRTTKLIDILNESVHYLKKNDIENPRLNAELILAHSLNLNRVDLYTNQEKKLQHHEIDHFNLLLSRRINHEPLQYILQETEFMYSRLKLDRSVLIPRPETELLVEFIISYVNNEVNENRNIHILDIGTGSGNIAISLARALSNAQITAMDVSQDALHVAKENARLNNVETSIKFMCADILSHNLELFVAQGFDIIVSNPPYIRKSDFKKLPDEIKLFEPRIALMAHDNGLIFYKAISEHGLKILKSNGLLACEIGYDQKQEVMDIFSSFSYSHVQCHKDLNGKDRFITAMKS